MTDIGWTALDVLDDVKVCDVFYMHTHSTGALVWSDSNDYWRQYPSNPPPLTPENIWPIQPPPSGGYAFLPARVEANGSGLPPYNSTGLPPINLAFLDTCSSGSDNLFAEGLLYPQGNVYTGGPLDFPEDQCEVGFQITALFDNCDGYNQAFWGALADGWDADTARRQLFSAYQGANKPNDPETLVHVWGDWATRLKGVYTGFLGQETRWYFDGGNLPLD